MCPGIVYLLPKWFAECFCLTGFQNTAQLVWQTIEQLIDPGTKTSYILNRCIRMRSVVCNTFASPIRWPMALA